MRFGCLLAEQDQFAEAVDVFVSLLRGEPADLDPAVRSAAWHNLAAVARQLGRYDEAAAWQQCSAGLALGGVWNPGAAPASDLAALALDALARGDLDLADDLLRRSLRIERTRGDARAEAADWGNLGIVFWLRGDLAGAVDCLRAALDLHRSAGHDREVGTDLMNLSQICADAGSWREAVDLLEQAVRHIGNATSPLLRGRAEAMLGEARRVLAAREFAPERN